MTDPDRRPGLASAIERMLELGIFNARWLMAPFYIGLVLALVMLMCVFVMELVHGIPAAFASPEEAILLVLSLIDLSLAGNLVLIVTFSGYENFVSKIDTGNHVDRPDWMGTVDFSGMKIKLIASIVAISAISLLRAFMRLAAAPEDLPHGVVPVIPSDRTLYWLVGLHMVFIVSGVLFALMDWLAEKTHVSVHGQRGRKAHGGQGTPI
jgi:uncharacterized protein (TIGR00645 family)